MSSKKNPRDPSSPFAEPTVLAEVAVRIEGHPSHAPEIELPSGQIISHHVEGPPSHVELTPGARAELEQVTQQPAALPPPAPLASLPPKQEHEEEHTPVDLAGSFWMGALEGLHWWQQQNEAVVLSLVEQNARLREQMIQVAEVSASRLVHRQKVMQYVFDTTMRTFLYSLRLPTLEVR